MRLIHLNPNSFRPDHLTKVENMKKGCIEREIDGIMLAETNYRYNSINKEKISKRLMEINKNCTIVASESGDDINLCLVGCLEERYLRHGAD